MGLPAGAELQAGDNADVRAQMGRLSEPQARRVVDSLEELENVGLVQKASVQIRRHGSAPLLMLYLLNNRELFLGQCKAGERRVRIDKKQVKIHEPSADAAVPIHHSADADPRSTGSLEVKEACEWFDNIWNTLGRPHVPRLTVIQPRRPTVHTGVSREPKLPGERPARTGRRRPAARHMRSRPAGSVPFCRSTWPTPTR